MNENDDTLDMAEMLGVTSAEYDAVYKQIGEAADAGISMEDELVILREGHDPHALLAGFFIGELAYHNSDKTEDKEYEWMKRSYEVLFDLGFDEWSMRDRDVLMRMIYLRIQNRPYDKVQNQSERVKDAFHHMFGDDA